MNVKESPTEVAVTMDFVLTLDLAGKIPLAAFADFLTEQRQQDPYHQRVSLILTNTSLWQILFKLT